MFQLLTIVTTITGIFTILDLFVEKNSKAKVAEFVFGFGTADFAGFESNAIKALLSLCKIDGRISYKLILFRYSAAISLFFGMATLFGAFVLNIDMMKQGYESTLLEVLEILIGIPIGALLFWPFDCWSLKVTDRIFGSRESASVLRFFGRVIMDILITLFPLILLAGGLFLILVTSVTPAETSEISILTVALFVGFLFTFANILGSLLVTIIQLLTLVVGVCLRTIMRLTRLNQQIAMVSRAHEFPFTFIGLVLGIVSGMSVVVFT